MLNFNTMPICVHTGDDIFLRPWCMWSRGWHEQVGRLLYALVVVVVSLAVVSHVVWNGYKFCKGSTYTYM